LLHGAADWPAEAAAPAHADPLKAAVSPDEPALALASAEVAALLLHVASLLVSGPYDCR
jgi:hypothetical protein